MTTDNCTAILAAIVVAGVGAFGVAARLRQQASKRRALAAQAQAEAETLQAARAKAAADQRARDAQERIRVATPDGGLAGIAEAGRRTPVGDEP